MCVCVCVCVSSVYAAAGVQTGRGEHQLLPAAHREVCDTRGEACFITDASDAGVVSRLIMSVCLSGVHRDAEEAAVVMETAGSEVAPPLPAEACDGQRRVPERVRDVIVEVASVGIKSQAFS